MIKWLGIHYKFPPVATVSSRRLYLLYQALSELTEDQVVVTSAEAAKRPVEAAFSHNFRLAQVGGRGLREWLYGAKHNVVPNAHKQRLGYDALVRLRETSPFDYWIGEGGPTYKKLAYRRAAKIIEQENITHIFSSFRPWVDHEVARKLKQQYPKVYWIADFRDLPMDPLRNPPYGIARHKKLLARRLAKVDEVWTVSEGLAEQFRAYHKKVRVVYGGLAKLPEPSCWTSDRFVINYSGSIYPGLQLVRPLLASLERLSAKGLIEPERILVRYAGRDKDLFATKLSQTHLPIASDLHDVLPLDQARRFQQQTQLNLLLSWATESYRGVLTAKLFDYLAAGRPILAILNGPDDPELRKIIEDSGSGKVFLETGWSNEPSIHSSTDINQRSIENNGPTVRTRLVSPRADGNRPAEVQKNAADQFEISQQLPNQLTKREDSNTIDAWVLGLYQKWASNNGQIEWKARPGALEHLQPLPILRNLLT
ncbi:MAG: hypothetical protein AAFP08_14215 [Bacteroidota bacterium]